MKRKFQIWIGLAVVISALLGGLVGTAVAGLDVPVLFEDDDLVLYQDKEFGARIALNRAGGVDVYCPCDQECVVVEEGSPPVVATETATAIPDDGDDEDEATSTPQPTEDEPDSTDEPETPQPTDKPEPTSTSTPVPTSTPEPTDEPEEDKCVARWVTHYDAKGRFVFHKCLKGWHGHVSHPGHVKQDDIGGCCTP